MLSSNVNGVMQCLCMNQQPFLHVKLIYHHMVLHMVRQKPLLNKINSFSIDFTRKPYYKEVIKYFLVLRDKIELFLG